MDIGEFISVGDLCTIGHVDAVVAFIDNDAERFHMMGRDKKRGGLR